MRAISRLRLAFLAVAVVLLVPGGFLVRRTLASLAAEREARQRTVALRIFDEMERFLSDFLAREDARPVGQYGFYLSAPGASPGVERPGVRSPLADPPDVPWVLGYFQVDPDGTVHTPLLPRHPEAARARGDWTPDPQRIARAEQVLRLAGRARAREVPREAPVAGAEEAIEPAAKGPDRALAKASSTAGPAPESALRDVAPVPRAEAAAPAAREEDEMGDAPPSGAFQVLQSLNRAASERTAERRQRLELAAAPPATAPGMDVMGPGDVREPAPAPTTDPAGPAARHAEEAAERPDAPEGSPSGPPEREETSSARPGRVATAEVSGVWRGDGPPDAARPGDARSAGQAGAGKRRDPGAAVRPPPPSPVLVDPLIGRRVDDAHLVLARTVLVGREGLRQGLVIRLPDLVAGLSEEVLAAAGLPGAELALAGDGPAGPGAERIHRHRFAEPFDALGVTLRLPDLGGTPAAGGVALLSGLLLAVGAVGLFALYRMVALALRFSERRSNFAAAVTHELKTPLTAIRMYGEMLRDGLVEGDDKRREYYATLTAESERLSRLVDNVLGFSRLERDAREMHWETGTPAPVVAETVEWLRPHAEREGFELVLVRDADLPGVRFDRDALVQVLVNLVGNALEHARDAADRRVTVSLYAREGRVVLAVRDRGPGVAPRHLPHVFEAFYRGEDELTRGSRGTGIGLALVKRLVERMGGRVSARNADEAGFEVRAELPAA